MAWAKNGTPDTLTSSGAVMTISDLTAKTFIFSLTHGLGTGGIVSGEYLLENNTATDYAYRNSTNGGTDDASNVNVDSLFLAYTDAASTDFFMVSYWINIDSEEKLVIMFVIESNTAGSGTAPNRREAVGKVDTTTNSGQFTRIDVTDNYAGSYNTGSNLSVLGTD